MLLKHIHTEETHHHFHRNLHDVFAVLDRGTMSDSARTLAKKIFTIVAEAEAEVHGIPVEKVHFHEVGAVDSIADIVGAAVLIDDLAPDDVIVQSLSEGTGTVHCQHGDLPVPVPAVLNIAKKYAIPLKTTNTQGEMITPTGIAIAAAVRTSTVLPDSYVPAAVGIGLGKRDFGRPNFLRTVLMNISGQEQDSGLGDPISLIESNIDDATGEMLAFAMDSLFGAGALDVHFVPCFTKKNRPAWLIRILVPEHARRAVEKTLFASTTTIGLRRTVVERTTMDRVFMSVPLPHGEIKVKRCSFDGIIRYYPEFDSVKEYSVSAGEDFQSVFDAAKNAAHLLDVHP